MNVKTIVSFYGRFEIMSGKLHVEKNFKGQRLSILSLIYHYKKRLSELFKM